MTSPRTTRNNNNPKERYKTRVREFKPTSTALSPTQTLQMNLHLRPNLTIPNTQQNPNQNKER